MRNKFNWFLLLLVIASGVAAWRIAHSPEAVAARCATYDLDRKFDDCVKSKSCAMNAGRFDEWYEYGGYKSNTYDCPRNGETK